VTLASINTRSTDERMVTAPESSCSPRAPGKLRSGLLFIFGPWFCGAAAPAGISIETAASTAIMRRIRNVTSKKHPSNASLWLQ